jgi:hypothetical protein
VRIQVAGALREGYRLDYELGQGGMATDGG